MKTSRTFKRQDESGSGTEAAAHRKDPARTGAARGVTWRYKAIAVVAATAAVLGLVESQVSGKPGAAQRIEQSPPPALFPDTDVSDWTTRLARQRRAADALFGQWRRQHGTARDDKAFALWVAERVPAPPSTDKRAAELGQLRDLARARTTAGRKAATWLEVYGKQDIWKLYLDDQRKLLPEAERTAQKAQLDAALTMAGTINGQLAARYKEPSPYILDHSLRPEKKIKPGGRCTCSYPSGHASDSAAAVTVLSGFAPHRAADYRWMQAEVFYSRVYMSGHVPSDLLAGALLGDLIGDYVLATNSHAGSPSAVARAVL